MKWVMEGIVLILCLWVFYEDVRHHAVSWYIFPLLFVTLLFKGLYFSETQLLFITLFINLAVVAFILLGTILYFSVKNRKIAGVINNQLGMGDVLMMAVLTAAFASVNLVVFLLAGFLFSIVIAIILAIITSKPVRYVPLAGFTGLLFFFTSIGSAVSGLDLYDGTWLYSIGGIDIWR
ncbi:MAG: prepilin peptidase [Bacteroidales bacterium]|nr:prepilin peptidase [Bacteroidales bacterium]